MTEKQLDLFGINSDLSIWEVIERAFPSTEYYEVEFKSAQGDFPATEFWKTYSAFANTNEGVIILGVSEKKGRIHIDGLTEDQIDNYKKYFWDNVNNPNTVSRNLLSNNDIKVVTAENKKVLTFRIPFASRTERPVFLTRNPFGNTYKRNHEGDFRCTDEEVKRMLADSSAELKRDSLILENYTVSDLDPTSIKQFRQLFISSKPTHPWHVLEDLDLLKRLGAYRVDRKTKKGGVTLSGLLMFGKEDSIREQESLPDYFPDFRERLSSDKQIRWTNRICPDGSWECNLLQFYLKVWPKISSTLPKPFALNSDERVDETPAHIALREAFVNALVHTDYSLSGNITIELDTEKFVFSNPGTLLVSVEQYYAGGVSECRNPSLQQMFMLIGRAEKVGSGVDKIMSGWKESHWQRPFLELQSQPDKVKLTMPMFSVIPQATLDELSSFFGDVSVLSADELTALSFCLIEGSISNRRLQYALGSIHSTDITSLLRRLCTNDYLESDNNGRWTTYRIKQKVDSSRRKVDSSKQKVDSSRQKVDSSRQKVDSSKRKVDSSRQKVDSSKRLRLSKESLEEQIMQICKDNYVRMEDVANTVDRSVGYLKNKVFPEMVKSGKLEKHFSLAYHPKQGYKTTKKYAGKL